MTVSVLKGTSIVSALTLVSRLLGFFRDLILARVFGASALMDSFFVAFRIPNLLRSVVGEGALTSAFVPVFSGELKHGVESGRRALQSIAGMLIFATLILSALGIVFAPAIVGTIAPGFAADPAQLKLCVALTRIMMPYIMFVSITALLNSAFNSIQIFGLGPIAQIVMNLVTIVGAIAAATFPPESGLTLLAWSVLAGGVLQVLVQLPSLARTGLSIIPSVKFFSGPVREVLRLMAPALVGSAVYQLSIFINTALASILESGSVSWLSYADRLAQLPIGLFTVALGSVLLPTLSHAAARDDSESFSTNLINSLRFTSFVIFPIAAGMAYFAYPLVAILFERGAFDSRSTAGTAVALQAYCVGLWGVSCYSVAVRGLLARKDTITPTALGGLSLLLGVVFAVLLMGPPDLGSTGWIHDLVLFIRAWLPAPWDLGHAGVALASGLASTLVLALLVLVVQRREPGMALRPFVMASVQAFTACCLMLGALEFAALPEAALPRLCVGVPLGAVIYIGSVWLLGSREMRETVALVRRKVVRRHGP